MQFLFRKFEELLAQSEDEQLTFYCWMIVYSLKEIAPKMSTSQVRYLTQNQKMFFSYLDSGGEKENSKKLKQLRQALLTEAFDQVSVLMLALESEFYQDAAHAIAHLKRGERVPCPDEEQGYWKSVESYALSSTSDTLH